MTESSDSSGAPSFLGRLLFSGVLTYMSVDGFLNNEKRVEIARSKDVPAPELLVPLSTGMFLVSNVLLLLWRVPAAAASGVVLFFVTTTPSIHDFWNLEGEERHANKINFCKNVALTGAAIAFLKEALSDD